MGIGLGWGWGAAIGAEYISAALDFEEAKSHRQNPLKTLEQQVSKAFAPKPRARPSHPFTTAELPPSKGIPPFIGGQ